MARRPKLRGYSGEAVPSLLRWRTDLTKRWSEPQVKIQRLNAQRIVPAACRRLKIKGQSSFELSEVGLLDILSQVLALQQGCMLERTLMMLGGQARS